MENLHERSITCELHTASHNCTRLFIFPRAGNAGDWAEPVVTKSSCAFSFAHEAAGPGSSTRHSLRPLLRGQEGASLGRGNRAAGRRGCVYQTPSLRASAKQSSDAAGHHEVWIASSRSLLAMTMPTMTGGPTGDAGKFNPPIRPRTPPPCAISRFRRSRACRIRLASSAWECRPAPRVVRSPSGPSALRPPPC